MAVRLEYKQLVELRKLLATVQGSEKTCGELSHIINSASSSDYQVTVDVWPDVRAVLMRSYSAVPQVRGSKCYVSVFATDHHALKMLLKHPGTINWSDKVSFGIPSDLSTVIEAVLVEQQIPFSIAFHTVLLKVTEDKLQLRPVPEGFNIDSLKPEHSALVNSSWKFQNGEDTRIYIKHLIETNPNLCMYNQDGDIIGWCLQKENTFLGMLHVREKYRGNGYGKVLVSQLAKMCLKTMDYICSFVEPENTASLKAHNHVGFDTLGSHYWYLAIRNG